MTSRDFAYWLQGYFEITNTKKIDEKQTEIIKNHLNLVFKHEIDKQYKEGDGTQEVHDGRTDFKYPDFPIKNNDSNLLRC